VNESYWTGEPITLTFGAAMQEANTNYWLIGAVALIACAIGNMIGGSLVIYWWNRKLGDEWGRRHI
jgi:membrane protein DedA with SNARE-associated domain